MIGELAGDRLALICGGSLGRDWDEDIVDVDVVLDGLDVGVDVTGGEDLNDIGEEFIEETINGGEERFVVRRGAKGELLEGLLEGEDGGDLIGDFLITPSPFIVDKLR